MVASVFFWLSSTSFSCCQGRDECDAPVLSQAAASSGTPRSFSDASISAYCCRGRNECDAPVISRAVASSATGSVSHGMWLQGCVLSLTISLLACVAPRGIKHSNDNNYYGPDSDRFLTFFNFLHYLSRQMSVTHPSLARQWLPQQVVVCLMGCGSEGCI